MALNVAMQLTIQNFYALDPDVKWTFCSN